MEPHRRASKNRWNADSLVDPRRCHTRSGFEGRHFGKISLVDYRIKGVRRLAYLKPLLCLASGSELSGNPNPYLGIETGQTVD